MMKMKNKSQIYSVPYSLLRDDNNDRNMFGGLFISLPAKKMPHRESAPIKIKPGPTRQLVAVSARVKNATLAATSSGETERQLVADGTVLGVF